MLSLFDIFSIGIGPSSSHTVGPMRAANDFVARLSEQRVIKRIVCHLYGSLASTGKGHGTDKAILLGLSGCQPDICETSDVERVLQALQQTGELTLANGQSLAFKPETDLLFCFGQSQIEHANALSLSAYDQADQLIEQQVYFSVGGGFIQRRGEEGTAETRDNTTKPVAYPFSSFDQLKAICQRELVSITQVMLTNQSCYNPSNETENKLWQVWLVMKAAVEAGITSTGELLSTSNQSSHNYNYQVYFYSHKVKPLARKPSFIFNLK